MFRVRLSDRANTDLREIQTYLAEYSLELARKHIVRLADTLETIGKEPSRWSYFFLTGLPYRSRLFFIGGASFWIIYEIREQESAVNILRIWNSRQNPEDFEF